MRIVIDIPEQWFCRLQNEWGWALAENVRESIKSGTILPKGHGRLIDADALRKSFQKSIDECHRWSENVKEGEMYARVSQALGTFVECSLRTKNAPTIIEADKEVMSDGK